VLAAAEARAEKLMAEGLALAKRQSELEQKLTAARASVTSLRSKLDAAESRASAAEERLELHIEQVAQLTQALAEAQAKSQELDALKRTAATEAGASERAVALAAELAESRSLNEAATRRREEAEQRLSDAMGRASAAEREVSRLRDELRNQSRQHEAVMLQKEQELAELRSRLHHTQGDGRDAHEDRETNSGTDELTLKSLVSRLQAELGGRDIMVGELRSHVDALESKVSTMQATAPREREEKEEQLTSLRTAVARYRERCGVLAAELASIQEGVSQHDQLSTSVEVGAGRRLDTWAEIASACKECGTDAALPREARSILRAASLALEQHQCAGRSTDTGDGSAPSRREEMALVLLGEKEEEVELLREELQHVKHTFQQQLDALCK
jgi:chromosome segregation ATPase